LRNQFVINLYLFLVLFLKICFEPLIYLTTLLLFYFKRCLVLVQAYSWWTYPGQIHLQNRSRNSFLHPLDIFICISFTFIWTQDSPKILIGDVLGSQTPLTHLSWKNLALLNCPSRYNALPSISYPIISNSSLLMRQDNFNNFFRYAIPFSHWFICI
jgi:hypothetical protein